jgi:Protein of unknown function (DUF3105)
LSTFRAAVNMWRAVRTEFISRGALSDILQTADTRVMSNVTDERSDPPWWADGEPSVRLTKKSFWGTHPKSMIASAVSAILFAVTVGYLAFDQTPPDLQPESFGWSERPTVEGLIGGCGPVYHVNENSTTDKIGYIANPTEPTETLPRLPYPTIVPVYGQFYETPADLSEKRVWYITDKDQPPVEQLLHNMWNGSMVIYYDRYKVRTEDLAPYESLATDNPALNAVLVPWPVDRGPLPMGRSFAIATWGGSQTCNRFVLKVFQQFRDEFPLGNAPGITGAKLEEVRRGETVSQ